jgi:Putative transposase of IS4/5 family (DUF4096)
LVDSLKALDPKRPIREADIATDVADSVPVVISTSNSELRVMRYELSDYEWSVIKPMLPNKPRGIPRVDDRRILNCIFWVLRSRIGRLTTVGQVATELGRLYRHARWGEIPVSDASRLATILAAMRQCLEASELERRITGMEAALTVNTNPVLPFRRAMR